MKLKPTGFCAFFTLRALIALALGTVSCLLALVALGAMRNPFDSGFLRSHLRPGSSNANSSPLLAKNKAATQPGGASKNVIGAGPAAVTQNPSVLPEHSSVSAMTNALGQTVYSISASSFDISPPLTELAQVAVPEKPETQRPELELPASRILHSDLPDPVTQVAPAAAEQAKDTKSPDTAVTGFNYDGVAGTGSFPPDNNGSVGNDQYVETVNTRYQVWSLNRVTKIATSILGPVNINTLWAGFGGACQTQNAGDPVVLYDKVANRWLITQFTSSPDASNTYYQCVAVSTSANATGTYARYAFAVPNHDFGDYPHYGVWSDAYYVMAHQFMSNGAGGFTFHAACFGAMDRAKMIAGDATATWQVILDPTEGGHMPADLDGFAPPPAGAPGIFASVHTAGMYLYRMKVDFAAPANTARTPATIMPIAPASAACGGGNCIPQPNSAFTIDSLADRLMFRLAYRNYIDHESLTVSHSVDPGVAGVVSGVRWYEFRLSGQPNSVCSTYPCTYQQGTIADAPNGRSRWMPSLAMDGAENMVVGYSTTGTLEATDAHSIRYTGRAKNDALGVMTVPETIIFTGQHNIVNQATVSPGRWGDYTSTSIDPADDCTFWHVNEYYPPTATTNGDWHTRVASASFAGTQCQPTTCTNRPTTAPGITSVSAIAPNKIQVNWTAVTPAAGSYAIERAQGAAGSEGQYQPLGSVVGSATSFMDTTVQGGLTYSYRVIAATDDAGRCQALVRSSAASATATGNCTLRPTFAGAANATSIDGPACGIQVNWTPAVSSCPLTPNISYNIYRGTVPDFVPAPANRVASCVTGPSSYVDTNALTGGRTYYYVVRAEDNSTGNGGACGGNEETNTAHVAGTAYGSDPATTVGTWTDGGGDTTAFLRLNATGAGNTADAAWRIVRSADDAGANHTPGGDYAYRTAGPGPNAIYGSNECASAETPLLTVGGTSVNLTYWERHQLEKGWDGVALEYSRNGGAWVDLPAPSNAAADGCMSSDVTGDYAPLECTGAPPANACGYPASKAVITGPAAAGGVDCNTYTTAALTAYARRCHFLTGLTPGDTIRFRWRMTSDPGAEFKGFYLDDIAVTNIRLPSACTTPLPGVPSLTGAGSRKAHGSAGPFDLPIALNGTAIEPRSSNGSHMIVLHFDRPIQSGSVAVTSGTGSVGSFSFSGNDMLVNLTGVANAQRLTLTATNMVAVGGGVLNSVSVQMGFLIGDTNGNGAVNATDISEAKAQSGAPATAANYRLDVTNNGVVNSSDISLIKSQSGAVLPPVAP